MKKIKIILPALAMTFAILGALVTESFSSAPRLATDIDGYLFSATTSCGSVIKTCATSHPQNVICERVSDGADLFGKSSSACDIVVYEKQ